MKYILLLLVSFSVSAVELSFIGPCSKTPVMTVDVSKNFKNIGELTVKTLTKMNVPFIGSEEGLASIFNTPIGDGALEILSDHEMRAYGWCYSVDGVAPEIYPHEVPVTHKTKTITWHYGFARYYKGEWVTQCTPAYSVKPDFLCPKEDRQ